MKMEVEFLNMKRIELQRCAKKAGIRANMKTEELIKALVAFHSKNTDREGEQVSTITQSPSDEDKHVEKVTMTTSSCEMSEDESKPPGGGRGRKRQRGRKEFTPEKQQAETTDTSKFEVEASTAITSKKEKEVKTVTPPKPNRQGQRTKRKTPPAQSPKSAQKRSPSGTEEAEVPPAKQQKVSPPPEAKEPTPQGRSSSRKRTFSASPPKPEKTSAAEQKEGNKENTPTVNRRSKTKVKRSASLGSLNKKQTPKRTPQRPQPKKSTVPAAKTGIPLPKIKPSEFVTPGKSIDLKKAHKNQFEKLESIDDYLERKRKRIEALTSSYKKKKPASAKKTPTQTKTPSTPKDLKPARKVTKRTSFFSPKPNPVAKQPSVTKTVKFKSSKLTTPAGMSNFAFGKASTEKRVPTPGARKSISVMNTSVNCKSFSVSSTTPFKFGNTSMSSGAGTPAKAKFDLKASLERPLSYKPYTGKLKPLTEVKPSNVKKPVSHVTKAKESLKKPKLTGRAERQKAAAKHRMANRNNNMMARRGLV